jgi:hypothetical protein
MFFPVNRNPGVHSNPTRRLYWLTAVEVLTVESGVHTHNPVTVEKGVQSLPFSKSQIEKAGTPPMNWKSRFALGVLTALAMMLLTYLLPRGGSVRDAALVQFPMTVGVWAIFVLLFVKLK